MPIPNQNRLGKLHTCLYWTIRGCTPFFSPAANRLKFNLLRPIHKRYLQLSLTYDCQCHCAHCGMSQHDRSRKKLSSREILNLIADLAAWNFGQVDFFGGEPLLDENIYLYVRAAARYGLFTHINTNGLLLSEENVKRLSEYGLSAISVSFDSSDPRRHDDNRGMAGSYEKAMAGAQRCIRRHIRTIMSIYANPDDVRSGSTAELVRIAKEKKFSRVRLLGAFKAGKLAALNPAPSSAEIEKQLAQILTDASFVKSHGIHNCFVPGKMTAYVSPYGDVQPCSMVPLSFGNIRQEPLPVILRRMRLHPLYSIKERGCIMNSEYMQKYFFGKVDFPSLRLPVTVASFEPFPELSEPAA